MRVSTFGQILIVTFFEVVEREIRIFTLARGSIEPPTSMYLSGRNVSLSIS